MPRNFSIQIIALTVAKRESRRLIADLDPDEWYLPPKPKWMRWSTYNRLVDQFDSYEEILESGIAELVAKLLGKYSQ